MDPGNKSAHHERTSCTEMLKRIDSLATTLQHNCTEIQDTAWQPGVPELAEQMGSTVSTLQGEIAKLRDELTAMDGRHQKVILENERLRQIVASTGAMAMPPPPRAPVVTEALSSPGGSSSSAVSSTAARVATSSVVASAAVTSNAATSNAATASANSAASSSRLSSGSSSGAGGAGGENNSAGGNVCDVCMASFKSRQTLLQHRHIHDPAPRFCCQLCGNKFRQQSGLYQHMRVVHRKA